MADQTQHKLHWGPIAVGIAILVVVVYPLSYGPAAWLSTHGYVPDFLVDIPYSPLWWLSEKLEWFGEIVEWYLGLWRIGVVELTDLI